MTPLYIVSVSLGSSRRNHRTQRTMLGRPILLERLGVDGDQAAARRLLQELDEEVDAFGIGGADLGVTVNDRYYALHSMRGLVAGLATPVVDGGGVRQVYERFLVQRLEPLLPEPIQPKRVLIGSAAGRYDMARSFHDAGYEAIYGDLGFVIGLPLPIRSLQTMHRLARFLIPPMSHLPIEVLYPTGDEQEKTLSRFRHWYEWATVIADDFHYLKRYMPARLDGKVIVTNTITEEDIELLRARGVAYLVTSTPRMDGRTFGTNVLEAALTALSGDGRPLTGDEIRRMVTEEDLTPTVLSLNTR